MKFRPSRKNAIRPSLARTRSLAVERLEDRTTPDATFAGNAVPFTGPTALIDAVAAAPDGATIVLDATNGDTYRSPGLISKSITIHGPNAGVNPNTGTRAPEVRIDTTSPYGPLDIATGKSLTVDGLAFDVAGGLGAVNVFATNYSVTFLNNIVRDQDPVYKAVNLDVAPLSGTGFTSATVRANLFERIGGNTILTSRAAVQLATGTNGLVADNVMKDVFSGVILASSVNALLVSPVVTNNRVVNAWDNGIQVGDRVSNPTVTFNTITNANRANPILGQRGGIQIFADYFGTGGGARGTVTVTNNLISASNGGVLVTDGVYPTGTTYTIEKNSIGVNPTSLVPPLSAGTWFGTGPKVDAPGNWLGTTTPAVLRAQITSANLRVQAYLSSAANSHPNDAGGGVNGFIPAPTPGNGLYVPNTDTTGPISGNIQKGVDLAAAYGLGSLYVQGDSNGSKYTENVTTGANPLALVPMTADGADGIGTVTIAGNLALGNTTLVIQFNNTTNDKLVVSGSVALGTSMLTPVDGATVSTVTQYTIIDNQSATATTGTFNGRPQSAPVPIGTVPFTIGYTAGTGNDVVLTLPPVSPPPPPPVPPPCTVTVTGTTLVIVGTNYSEDIEIERRCGALRVEIERNCGCDHTWTIYSPITTIVVYALGGNDEIEFDCDVTAKAVVFGGDGCDEIEGGGGPSVLLGGNGDDEIRGNSGRDVLIGGWGEDDLRGGSGSDLLIGGYTTIDGNLTTILSVLAGWSAAPNFTAAVTAVSTVLHGGANPTVFDDGERDTMRGGGDKDWFFANTTHSNQSNRDRIYDLSGNEIVTQITQPGP